MAVSKADGTAVTKAAFPKTAVSDPAPAEFTIDENVYATFAFDGVAGVVGPERGQKLLFTKGQRVTQADIDAAFPTASISTVTPATGPIAGGTALTIKGEGFSGASGVTVGGVAATAFSVVNDKTIKCTTPATTAGAKAVVVLDDGGNVTKSNAFTSS